MARDGSLSNFPNSLDQFAIKWPLSHDRINGEASATRNDLERSDHWNHMFDACLNIERHAQKMSGSGLITYNATGGVVTGQSMLLSWQNYTLPASGASTEWVYTLETPAVFGSTPFADWRFNVQPSVYVNIMDPDFVRPAPASIGAMSDFDYRPEILSAYQPHVLVEPVTGRVFKLRVRTIKMYGESQKIGELEENCQRATTTEHLGAKWVRYGDYAAMGIGNPTGNLGGAGTHLYLCSEGEYGSSNVNFWYDNWGVAYPQTMGISNDQQVIFSPYGWFGSGVDVGDYMFRVLFGLRVSGEFGDTNGDMNMYAVVLGDQTMPASNRPTIGRLVKITDTYFFDINAFDGFDLQTASASSILYLGQFPLKLSDPDNLPNLRYRFRVQGTSLTVDEATDGSTYSNVLTVSDSDITQGTPGMFVLPMRGTGSGEHCRRLMFFNYLQYQVLSNESPCDVRAQVLYSLVGAANPQTQTL